MGAPSTAARPVTVGRLAPSPTGLLHLGHARSFLAAWWSARAADGRVVLRTEDLDGDRCAPEFADAARRDLEWLGLDWDAELLQSADLSPYEEAVGRLLAAGDAYPCVCSRSDIRAALSAPHAGGEIPYPGTCRGRFESVEQAQRATGRIAGVRLTVPEGPRTVRDALAGDVTSTPADECGDVLLLRRDGAVAYQLAVVVDDGRQGVTEVVRGDDLLASAARQEILQERLGLPHPRWVHLPLVVDPEGRRLAKRDGDLSLAELRGAGVDPARLVAWIAGSLGLGSHPDRSGAAAWIDAFDLDRVPRGPAVFGPADLAALRA